MESLYFLTQIGSFKIILFKAYYLKLSLILDITIFNRIFIEFPSLTLRSYHFNYHFNQ